MSDSKHTPGPREGDVYRMKDGESPAGSMGRVVRVSRVFPDAIGACRWVESKRAFSKTGFSLPTASFLATYEKEKSK